MNLDYTRIWHFIKHPHGGGNAAQGCLSNTINPHRRKRVDGAANANMCKEGDTKHLL